MAETSALDKTGLCCFLLQLVSYATTSNTFNNKWPIKGNVTTIFNTNT